MRWFIVAVSLSLAAYLIFLAVPRIAASVLKAPAFATLWAAHRGKPVAGELLDRAADYLEAAARWEDSAQLRSDRGFLLLLEAEQRDSGDPVRANLVEDAAKSLKQALSRAPARPHAWLRLATARMMEAGPSAAVAEMLERSFEAGRFVGELTVPRLELVLWNWDHLGFQARLAAGSQIRYAWENDPRGVIGIAKKTGRDDLIRMALRSLPEAGRRFDSAVGR